jgi:hypothetical protein
MSDLQTVPGVGLSIERDFLELDIYAVNDLRQKDPELLFEKLCKIRCKSIDRCVLYVFRCAVYYAEMINITLNFSSGGTGKTERGMECNLKGGAAVKIKCIALPEK